MFVYCLSYFPAILKRQLACMKIANEICLFSKNSKSHANLKTKPMFQNTPLQKERGICLMLETCKHDVGF